MDNTLTSLALAGLLFLTPTKQPSEVASPIAGQSGVIKEERLILASETLDLDKRNPNKTVSDIFRDNILLNLHYIKGDAEALKINDGKKYYGEKMIDWDKTREPFEFSLILEPGALLAFHDNLLPEFKGMKVLTGWTQFSVNEGYKVADGLSGDGVCHLATLINWVSSEAGLAVTAKVNHDFYPVPGVERKYGTSIVYIPGAYTTQMQNLYAVNNHPFKVKFVFKADKDKVKLDIVKN